MISKAAKYVIAGAGVVTALGTLAVPIVWAADQRYWTTADAEQFEARQLKREIKRLELRDHPTPEDSAMLEYLRQELEELQ